MEKEDVFRKVGQNIREERISKNLTMKQLADKVEMEYNNINRIEKGRTNPTLSTLYKISKALNVPLKKIMDI